MKELLKQIGSFFTYNEPKNEELGFELLEDENEDSRLTDENNQNAPNTRDNQKADQQQQNYNPEMQSQTIKHSNEQNSKKSIKQPKTVEKWNENRRSESTANKNTCKPQNNTDVISTQLCENLATIKQKFHMPQNQDIVIREFKVGRKIKAFMAYMLGMVDKKTIDLAILPKLMAKDTFDELDEEYPVDYLIDNILSVHSVKKSNNYSDAVIQVLNGVSTLFVEGCGRLSEKYYITHI